MLDFLKSLFCTTSLSVVEDAAAAVAGADTATDTTGEAAAEGDKPKEPPTMIEAIFGVGGEGNVGDGAKPPAEDKPAEGEAAAAAPELDKDGKSVLEAEEVKPAAKPVDEKELFKTPEGLNKKSEKRFTQLVEVTKARTTERDTVIKERDEIKEKFVSHTQLMTDFNTTMKEAGIGPQQMQAYVTYSTAVNSGNFQVAEMMLKQQIRELSLLTGKPFALEDIDPLSEYPDLQKEVAEFKITPEHGLEIARGRRREIATKQASEQATNATQAEEQRVTRVRETVQKSLAAVDTFLAGMAKKDIDFKVKEDKILAKVDHIVASYPPEKWATIVQDLYDQIEIVRSPDAPKPGEQPLRGGGKPLTKAAPKSMYEAIFPEG